MSKLPEERNFVTQFWRLPDTPNLNKTNREWVYFIQGQCELPLIKIGKTHRLKFRLATIQGMCPVELKLVGVISAPRGAEQIIHAMFSEDRMHGEWFRPTERILDFLKGLPRGGAVLMPTLKKWAAEMGLDAEAIHENALNYKTGKKTIDRELVKLKDKYLSNKLSEQNFERLADTLVSSLK